MTRVIGPPWPRFRGFCVTVGRCGPTVPERPAPTSSEPTQIDVTDDVVSAVRARPASSTALVVGHTNTVPEIIAGVGGPAGETIAGADFDRLFVLSRQRLSRLRYGA